MEVRHADYASYIHSEAKCQTSEVLDAPHTQIGNTIETQGGEDVLSTHPKWDVSLFTSLTPLAAVLAVFWHCIVYLCFPKGDYYDELQVSPKFTKLISHYLYGHFFVLLTK